MSQRILTVSCLAVVFVGVLEFKLIHDTDIFWQVKLGQIMLDECQILERDRLTYTHAGEPAPAIGWLAQVMFAWLYGLGGWHLARAVHHIALVGSLLLAAATCRRAATSPFSVVVAMTIGFVVMLSNADLRPQSFALFCFATFLALARGRLPFGLKLIVAVPLLVVWQNTHPSVMVGAIALVGLAVADLFERGPGRGLPWELATLTLLALLSTLATPIGWGIFNVSRANLRIGRDVLHVPEWMPPWSPLVFNEVLFYWVAFLGSLIALHRLWNRFTSRDKALFIVMTILSFCAARFIIFWAVALVPFWAELVEQVVPGSMFVWARGRGRRTVRAVRSITGLAAGVAIVLGLHPARFGRIVRPEIPLDGVHALVVELPAAARIYNDYFWAGPLLLDGGPEWRMAVDGRLYMFSDLAEWREIEDARAGRISLDELERRHRPDAFFLYPGGEKALIESLSCSPRWRTCYSGPTCVAFVRAR